MTLYGHHLEGIIDQIRAFNAEFYLCRRCFLAQHEHPKKCQNEQGFFKSITLTTDKPSKQYDNNQQSERGWREKR